MSNQNKLKPYIYKPKFLLKLLLVISKPNLYLKTGVYIESLNTDLRKSLFEDLDLGTFLLECTCSKFAKFNFAVMSSST